MEILEGRKNKNNVTIKLSEDKKIHIEQDISTSIYNIKLKISLLTGIDIEKQVLKIGNTELYNGEYLSGSSVNENLSLDLFIKPRKFHRTFWLILILFFTYIIYTIA